MSVMKYMMCQKRFHRKPDRGSIVWSCEQKRFCLSNVKGHGTTDNDLNFAGLLFFKFCLIYSELGLQLVTIDDVNTCI